MICYVKTIHSHTVAEIFKKPVVVTATLPIGSICQLKNGYLVAMYDTSLPKYLIIESKKPTDGKKSLDCIRLIPGMVLKSTHDFGNATIYEGALCSFDIDSELNYDHIVLGGTDAELLSLDGDVATIVTN